MTGKQKIEMRRSEVSQRLAELAATDQWTRRARRRWPT